MAQFFSKLQRKFLTVVIASTLVSSLGFLSSPAFAEETIKENVEEGGRDIRKASRKASRKVKDKTCEMVNGKLECAAKKAKHRIENGVDNIKDKADGK